MPKRYVAVFPWDFKGKALAEEKIESLMRAWATFLRECQHPFYPEYSHHPNPTPDYIASCLAEMTVKSCMAYGDKMALEHWKYMIDSLLRWLQDKEAAIKLRERNVPISSEYRWYGVLAWHELSASAKDVKNEILAGRIRTKAQQDSRSAAIMSEYRSCYPERWRADHKLCFRCPNAVKDPYPENFPWCRIRIKTGQPASEKTCIRESIKVQKNFNTSMALELKV